MNYALLAALKECVLAVANEVRLSTRRGKAEAKELPFVSTFLFSSGEERVLLTKRRLPLLRLCLATAKQTRPRLLAAASAATQKPPPSPLHVRGCCAMRSFIWRLRATNLNLSFSRCGSRRLKFANLTSNLSVKNQGEVFYRNILLRKNATLVLRWI